MAADIRADVIVVGSGPGGATVARALARGGRRVLLLERGRDHRGLPHYGTYAGPLAYADRGSLLRTPEGLTVVRPLMVGGATSMYCGCAAPPPAWLARYGVDLAGEAAAAAAELGLAPLPAELRGAASTRVAEAGRRLGYAWEPQLKFMWPGRAGAFACGARCMLGCRCGAKWSAAEYVDDARAAGALVLTGVAVERVLRDGPRACGVSGRRAGQPFRASADTVVLAAGGIGTPRILQRSGVPYAGEGLTVDTTAILYGMLPEGPGVGADPPMTWSFADEAAGFMLSTLVDPWLLYPLVAAEAGPARLASWPGWGRALGVMVKLTDEVAGSVGPRRISKPLTARDRERLAAAETVARATLLEAGADGRSIFRSPLRGTHPGSTVRIGELVDERLRSELPGLFVCDASVFPEALGRPTVLTIVALARRLAAELLS